MKYFFFICIFVFVFSSDEISSQEKLSYPQTKKVKHIDKYFGTEVSDPYVWLEDMQSSEVKRWVDEENKLTEDYLNKIPFREKIRRRITEIRNYPRYSAPFKAGGYYFFTKNDGLQNQSVIYRQEDLNSEPEVFLDPNKFSIDGTVAITATYPSWDGKYLAYIISRAGSDWQEIYVMDIVTKEKLKDSLNWVKFSDAAWQGNGFYYNRYEEAIDHKLKDKNQNSKVYYHAIGNDQSQDQLIYEDKEHPERFLSISTTEDQKYLFLALSEKGKDGNQLFYKDLRKADLRYHPISESFDHNFWVAEANEDEIFILTNKDAPKNKLIAFIPSTNSFTEVLPEKENVLNSVNYVNEKLILQYTKDATDRAYVFDRHRILLDEIELPALGSVFGLSGKKGDKEIFYTFTSFNYPPTIYKYDIDNHISSVFRRAEVNLNPDDCEVKQVFYPSKDGTKIPLFLVYKKGLTLDGNNPTLLYGYGGFNSSLTPSFSSTRFLFLENGGVYAVANLRGGGEYGEDWHKAGMQLNKQNVFDDFISAAEYLIREKYTSSNKLAVQGGSNGGLLVGAVINQRPELFKVALPAVGVMDMLKFHKYTIGWAWITDYGSSDDSIHFKNLYAYSPLHNIKAQNYPATLITTSDHDDRVVPLHSYKYAATLQEKNIGDNPVLLRVETDAGHGLGKPISKSIDEQTDIWSFLFYNLEIEFKQ